MEYTESDLVRIAKRENNSKRGYLVVNPLQGKHIPVSPSKALGLFNSLADIIRNEYAGERLLLIGFAETATAIGAQAAVALGARYMQTTRESVPGAAYLFFSEEHSHATEQKLVKNDIDAVIGETDRIVFVEDEVTTGKTILNIIDVLKKSYPYRIRFSVASLLNGMTEENIALYKRKDIRLHYLVKTDHSLYDKRAEKFAGDGNYYACIDKKAKDFAVVNILGRMDARRLVEAEDYKEACEKLWQGAASVMGRLSNENILVVGTEEFMYPALYIGVQLEKEGNMVLCHSTTRSPITVSLEEEYPLHSRYELRSLYDCERKTFLYDIGKYDRVIIVTDAPDTENGGAEMLVNALQTQSENITLIRWC